MLDKSDHPVQIIEPDVVQDCCISRQAEWFRYRAAAIIIEDGCVLLAHNESSDYYYSVGGGVHIGESAQAAVMREVREETGVDYQVDRLAFIHENFFIGDGILKGKRCHEVALYFLMKPRGTREIYDCGFCAEGRETMHWLPIDRLRHYKAYPEFFAKKLDPLPSEVEHIVTVEEPYKMA